MSARVKLTSTLSGDVVFDQPQVILVEGADDQAVVEAMIRHESLEGFHVHDMGGKSSWSVRVQTILKQPEFQVNVRTLGLLKDADDSPAAAWQSCAATVRNCGLHVPDKATTLAEGDIGVAIMIAPSMSGTGAIEDLCMTAFDETRMACVRSYFACLGAGHYARVQAKAHVQAYLAGLPGAPRNLAIAARKGTLDMSASAFDELRAFVHALVVAADTAPTGSLWPPAAV